MTTTKGRPQPHPGRERSRHRLGRQARVGLPVGLRPLRARAADHLRPAADPAAASPSSCPGGVGRRSPRRTPRRPDLGRAAMQWLLRRDQGRRLTVAAAIAGLAFAAQGQMFTSASLHRWRERRAAAFSTGTWCTSSAYPADRPCHDARRRGTTCASTRPGLVAFAADSAPGSPPNAVAGGLRPAVGRHGTARLQQRDRARPRRHAARRRCGWAGPPSTDLTPSRSRCGSTSREARGVCSGFSNTAAGSSSRYDRHLYLDNTGHVRFGIWTGTGTTVTSDTVDHRSSAPHRGHARTRRDAPLRRRRPAGRPAAHGDPGRAGLHRLLAAGLGQPGLLARAQHGHVARSAR